MKINRIIQFCNLFMPRPSYFGKMYFYFKYNQYQNTFWQMYMLVFMINSPVNLSPCAWILRCRPHRRCTLPYITDLQYTILILQVSLVILA